MKRKTENFTKKTINVRRLQRKAKIAFFKEITVSVSNFIYQAGGKKVKDEMLEKGRWPKCTLPKCGVLENNGQEEPLISNLILL